MRWPLLLLAAAVLAAVEPIRVCATVPELGDLVRQVGGVAVEVTVFARPGDDPHRVDAKPSFAVALARADLLVATGFELEVGWLPPVVASARNPRLRPGQPGWLEAAEAVADPIGVPTGPVDRSAGDVHAQGNPHCLLDPLVGFALADLIRQRLTILRPEAGGEIARAHAAFRSALAEALVGPRLADLDAAKLGLLARHGRLLPFLEERGRRADLGGWLGRLAPSSGMALAADHDLYPYFARAFGLRVTVLLEPKPGVPPSARHLAQVAGRMRAEGIGVVLASPYFDRRAIDAVAQAAGARVAEMAHQAGSRPGTDGYVAWLDANVQAVAAALAPR